MKTIELKFTQEELDIITRALTGYEQDLIYLIDVVESLDNRAIEEKERLKKVKSLDEKIRVKCWGEFKWIKKRC